MSPSNKFATLKKQNKLRMKIAAMYIMLPVFQCPWVFQISATAMPYQQQGEDKMQHCTTPATKMEVQNVN